MGGDVYRIFICFISSRAKFDRSALDVNTVMICCQDSVFFQDRAIVNQNLFVPSHKKLCPLTSVLCNHNVLNKT
jgi:hypothetical protein